MKPPRVTEILKACGLIEPSRYAAGSAERGTAVHLACQYLDEGDLDEESLPPEIRGYLDAYKAFLTDGQWKWIAIEKRIESAAWRYCGTVDRIGADFVLDIKSGQAEPWHAIQLAAYAMLVRDSGPLMRYALYLESDGRYSLRSFGLADFPRDWAIFWSCLNLYNWKVLHGYINCRDVAP